jgi:hypothetical protein
MRENKPQRRHHYVPEFYLKRWQLGGDRLLEFSKPRGLVARYRWVSPKQTGYLDKLYFLEHLPIDLQNGYENQFFTPVDTKAAQVLELFEAGDFNLDSFQRSSWARFIMSLTFRAPETIQSILHQLTQDVFNPSPEREWLYRRRRRPDQPKTLVAALEAERNEGDLRHFSLEIARGVTDSPKIGQHFINMVWGYRVLPFDAPALLTSDRPIMWAFAMSDPRCHIILPTGPKSLFWAAQSPEVIATIQTGDGAQLAGFLNDTVTRRAAKYVWGSSLRQHDYVKRFMGVDPARTIPDTLIEQRWHMLKQRRLKRR